MIKVTPYKRAKPTPFTNGYKIIENVMLPEFDETISVIPAMTAGRTSKQIKAEIKAKFGFIPPFFLPAEQTPEILENLWQQTLSAYVNNPLPALFKEKLSAYLSRFCAVPYCMICHSCTLRPLGMSAVEVLKLLESPFPTAREIEEHLKILTAQSNSLINWPESNSALETSLLYCAIFIALPSNQGEHCRQEIRRILSPENYQYLVTFIAYVKSCHVWMEAHSEIAYQADERVITHLAPLLESEPKLAEFFDNYQQRVKHESQNRAAQLAELTLLQRQEEIWRQQAERERLVTQIAQRIRQSLDLSEILNTTVSEVRQFLQTERVFIYRFSEDWSGSVSVESVAPGCLPIQGRKITDSFFAKAASRELYKQGQTQSVDDIYTAGFSQCHVDLLSRLQVRANLVIPIVQGQQLWGLLVANHCSEPRQWQELEINLLKQLATQVAIAIQQSMLFEQIQTELIERQKSEQKIREQAALLDVATDAIIVQALDNQIRFWNKSAERLYGWNVADVFGKNGQELLFKENSPQLQQAQKLVVEYGSWQGELHQFTKEGKEIIVSSRWTLVLDSQGQPQSILIVNTDITEKKQLEAQFLHTQRLESIGTLAGGIAHDLNNVLTPIITSAQLLLHTRLDSEKRQRLLTIIEGSAKRGAALVKQVLSFARGMEGQQMTIHLRDLLFEIQHIALETFPKSIETYVDIVPDLWLICGDITQLHQVLMNLVVNARDAMPDGGTLKLAAENVFIDDNYTRMNLEATVGSYTVITVSDTGTGMTSETVSRIFEPFFTTKEQGKGTGLGLSILRGIIKSHGGFVTVESEVGKGTQFHMYFPAVLEEQTLPEPKEELLKGNQELILVVDDEAAICESTKTSLEKSNYRVITASDGIEALVLYVQHKDEISAVLMDMMMPEMDGLTTIRMLKQVNPLVSVISVSGIAESSQVDLALYSGAKTFLSKPYTLQELLKTLNTVLLEDNLSSNKVTQDIQD
ncbi:ATP-binding protein [Nostoc sp. UHCC 0302]|uniref:hybrid sensor histidine kinase/response regulator n=1 Tax=Nostoc sp. UHCC 0302 TaxID=3134896 RepID=UPI00311CB8FB